MTVFTMEPSLSNVKVSMKNYPKFYNFLLPKIHKFLNLFSFKYHVDKATVESVFIHEIYNTIKLWNKHKGAQFETFYWHRVKNTLINIALKECVEQRKIAFYAQHLQHNEYNNKHSLYPNKTLDQAARTETVQAIITEVKKVREFDEILRYITFFTYEGQPKAKSISLTVHALMSKYQVSDEQIYKKLRLLREYLCSVAKDMDYDLGLSNSDKDVPKKEKSRIDQIHCNDCYEAKNLTKALKKKLIKEHGSLEIAREQYYCPTCKGKVDKSLRQGLLLGFGEGERVPEGVCEEACKEGGNVYE